jgi:hypothetical protein
MQRFRLDSRHAQTSGIQKTSANGQTKGAVGQDAEFEDGVEPVFHKSRQVRAWLRFSLRGEGRGVLLQLGNWRYSVVCSGRWRS